MWGMWGLRKGQVAAIMRHRNMAKLFISQERLDSWSVEERVKVEGNRMTLVRDGRAFRIEPAVRFVKVSGNGSDPNGLVGKVKSVARLTASGGEHYLSSAIVGDTAYDVQNGFLGDPDGRGQG